MYFVRLHYQNAKLNVFTQQYQPIRTGAPIDDSIDFFDDDGHGRKSGSFSDDNSP